MNMPIRDLLRFHYKLSWYQFIFLKMKKAERFELLIYAGLCLLSAAIAIFKLLSAQHGDVFFGASLGVCLLLFGLLCWRGVLLDKKTAKRLELEYGNYPSKGEQFSLYSLKLWLLRKKLQELNCCAKEDIDAIINVLKYEASVPVYQSSWHKFINAVFFLFLGAYLSFVADLSSKDDLTPLLEWVKLISTLLFMLISCILILEVTVVKLIADWKMRSKYHVELIRFLEEIRWDLARSK
jgi:hypothetical protein